MPANIVVNFDSTKKGIEINGERYDYDKHYSLQTIFPQRYKIQYDNDQHITLELSQDTRRVPTLTSPNSDGVMATTKKDGKIYGITGYHDKPYVVFSIKDSQIQNKEGAINAAINAITSFINNILHLEPAEKQSAIAQLKTQINNRTNK